VVKADSGESCLQETKCDERSELDSGECGFLVESSRYHGHVLSSSSGSNFDPPKKGLNIR